MTLIDSNLARTLGLELHHTNNIPVAGIGSKHVSPAYVDLPIFFYGDHNIAKVTVEAHLVDELAAQLLLGMDVMGHEGFRMDLEAKTVRIASCMGFTFSVDVHTKPHHQERRTVRAATTAVIPPRTYMKVDITTPTLPTDRHYLFTGHHAYASFYSQDLNDHHSHLRVALSTSHVAYEEALTATLNCVRGLPGRILLPTTNPVRRALLKKMALESQDSLKDPLLFHLSDSFGQQVN
ncbi:hypothetical protein N7501_006498 [Penicillium viridicatum]|nr:hypothetical protein N7501_006498 [Penicillium viridicatum]